MALTLTHCTKNSLRAPNTHKDRATIEKETGGCDKCRGRNQEQSNCATAGCAKLFDGVGSFERRALEREGGGGGDLLPGSWYCKYVGTSHKILEKNQVYMFQQERSGLIRGGTGGTRPNAGFNEPF
mmetsp:Transcript_6013/g.17564  ORF Transcript_6013/g.17564 Transcript_6013/m.17564 type:complete len:126 (-) Transcript_6013:182-559(-)